MVRNTGIIGLPPVIVDVGVLADAVLGNHWPLLGTTILSKLQVTR